MGCNLTLFSDRMWFVVWTCLAAFLCGLAAGGAAPNADTFQYLENGQIKVGLDMSKGGTIGYLSAAKSVRFPFVF